MKFRKLMQSTNTTKIYKARLTKCPGRYNKCQQELSYRKQIARQLRTQYAEGIDDNTVTLKSRLTATQGHWKRNH